MRKRRQLRLADEIRSIQRRAAARENFKFVWLGSKRNLALLYAAIAVSGLHIIGS